MKHLALSDTDTDARTNIIAQELFQQLNLRFAGKKIDRGTLSEMKQFLYDVKVRAKLAGAKFPDLTLLPFPRRGGVEVVRRDLDRSGVERVIQRVKKKYSGVTPAEIAWAVRYGFPDRAQIITV